MGAESGIGPVCSLQLAICAMQSPSGRLYGRRFGGPGVGFPSGMGYRWEWMFKWGVYNPLPPPPCFPDSHRTLAVEGREEGGTDTVIGVLSGWRGAGPATGRGRRQIWRFGRSILHCKILHNIARYCAILRTKKLLGRGQTTLPPPPVTTHHIKGCGTLGLGWWAGRAGTPKKTCLLIG